VAPFRDVTRLAFTEADSGRRITTGWVSPLVAISADGPAAVWRSAGSARMCTLAAKREFPVSV